MGRVSTAVYVALIGFAFVAAPHACEWGLNAYAAAGLVSIVGIGLGMFIWRGNRERPMGSRAALWIAGVVPVWIAGLFIADMRLLCRLF